MRIEVARAQAADLPVAAALLQEYYEAVGVVQRDSPEAIAAYLDQDACAFWIASLDGEPAGCVVLRPLAAVPAATECKRLYVRSPYRGLGIARALLAALEDHARASGVRWIYLDSKDDLVDALRLYTRHGYEPCARYNDNPQATIFLRKDLRRAASVPV